MNSRTIRIIERCEFGEPGDLVRPEPWDIATLLVEIRGVAEYVHQPPAPPLGQAVTDATRPASREPRRRRPRDTS